jgi:hypothetical protein
VSDATLSSRINAARRAVGDTGAEQRQSEPMPAKAFVLLEGCKKLRNYYLQNPQGKAACPRICARRAASRASECFHSTISVANPSRNIFRTASRKTSLRRFTNTARFSSSLATRHLRSKDAVVTSDRLGATLALTTSFKAAFAGFERASASRRN